MLVLMIAAAVVQSAPAKPTEGPYNLVLRWGSSNPVVMRYESRDRCELAALEAVGQGDALFNEVDAKGKVVPAQPQVKGPNAPWAFCIPA